MDQRFRPCPLLSLSIEFGHDLSELRDAGSICARRGKGDRQRSDRLNCEAAREVVPGIGPVELLRESVGCRSNNGVEGFHPSGVRFEFSLEVGGRVEGLLLLAFGLVDVLKRNDSAQDLTVWSEDWSGAEA